jgi:hypothetical protein
MMASAFAADDDADDGGVTPFVRKAAELGLLQSAEALAAAVPNASRETDKE